MANWFKLYETDLDETRMRFALTKLPEVWPVWTAILMECCKHRDANIPWGASDQELFGFADRLKISIPKVNEAINILCSIEYVKKSNGHLNVLKWNEKQDDYLARKSRGYWDKRKKSQCFTVKHEKKSDSHIEERRGEEKREEENKEPSNSAGAGDGVFQTFIKNWSENFEKAHKVKYQFDGGRDGKAVKELLRMGILPIDLLEIAKKAWVSPLTPFLRGRILTIHGFRENINQIQTGLKNGNSTQSLNPAADRRNAGTFGGTDYGKAAARRLAEQDEKYKAYGMGEGEDANAASPPATTRLNPKTE